MWGSEIAVGRPVIALIYPDGAAAAATTAAGRIFLFLTYLPLGLVTTYI